MTQREHPFVQRLHRGVLLADGAMGTELYARGVEMRRCFELTNLNDPDLVQQIHLDYLQAGAELIETNTFGANRPKLEAHDLADQLYEINRQGGRIARYARDAAGSTAFVAGSIGPLGHPLRPFGDDDEEEARRVYQEQAAALIDGGVDVFILETFGDLNMLCLAVRAIQEISDLPIIAQATFDEDGRTPRGQTVSKVTAALLSREVSALGVNCSVGPQVVSEVAAQMVAEGAPFVSAMPNAGMPIRSGGRLMYMATPAYFAEMVPPMAAAGIGIIGGCCGTTPAHIAAMRQALDALQGSAEEHVPVEPIVVSARAAEQGEAPTPTSFAQKLAAGKFVTSVELSPPKGFKVSGLLRRGRALAESGLVDAINVTDSPMARVRMGALSACSLLQGSIGIETILHFTTRDRNLMGIEADLIGAHAQGIRNVLALTGDPPSLGDFSQATGVFDVDSIGLVRILSEMKQGRDLLGTEMGYRGAFCVGVAVDPTKPDIVDEARRLHEKVAAGAEFVMTQPIYDLAVWHRFLKVYGTTMEIPVLLGLLPLLSQRHARFLHNELPGITLSEEALGRMERAGAEGRAEGVAMAQEMLIEAKSEFQGVYLMPSFNRHEVALEVLGILEA